MAPSYFDEAMAELYGEVGEGQQQDQDGELPADYLTYPAAELERQTVNNPLPFTDARANLQGSPYDEASV